jgi:hypothetical protein
LPHLAEGSHAIQKNSDAQLTVDSPVEAKIVVANVSFSPCHSPSRKRPCSLCKDHLARLEVPQGEEPTVEEVDNGSVTIEILEGLPHPAEGSHETNTWKPLSKRVKRSNFYEQDAQVKFVACVHFLFLLTGID